MILDDILAHKREEVEAARRACPAERLRDAPRYHAPRRGFRAALAAAAAPAVIAEIKRASPSRGLIRAHFDAAAHARSYERGGATCLSVLTDRRFFQGELAHLAAAREACRLPCLRKDFLVDEYQIDEARAAGADAVLVIAASDEPARLEHLAAVAGERGLDVLVEVHDEAELAWAAGSGARLIGVNNRDLRTFETRLETTERLAAAVPPGVLLVAESGISDRGDLERMLAAGAHAVLVGESLMRRDDPGEALRELLGCR